MTNAQTYDYAVVYRDGRVSGAAFYQIGFAEKELTYDLVFGVGEVPPTISIDHEPRIYSREDVTETLLEKLHDELRRVDEERDLILRIVYRLKGQKATSLDVDTKEY